MSCLHCKLPTQKNSRFCCPGCRFAYETINKLGLSSYYQNRTLINSEITLKNKENPSNYVENIDEFSIKNDDDSYEAYFLVKGIHCAACIWLIENILKKQENVKLARVNMTQKRLRLSWFGDKDNGIKLIKIINNLGYKLIPYDYEELQNEEKKYSNEILKALSIAGFGVSNIMLISIALWSSDQEKMGLFTHNFLYWLSALIALPVIIYSGRIFFKSAFISLKNKKTNMDVPISVAILITSLVSFIEIYERSNHAYFDSTVMLIFFLLIARYLDFLTKKKASKIAQDYSFLGAVNAVIIDENGNNKVILAKNIKKGMVLNVAIGDKIAADGIIISGNSDIDTSIVTGESIPKSVKEGEEVFAGTINFSAPIKVKVTKEQKDSLIAKISKIISDLEQKKGKYTKIADKISQYYTPVTHLLALATILIWYYIFNQSFKLALLNAVAVLIITCPCALALAVPIVNIVTNSRLLKKGIIIKSGDVFEKIDKIDQIIFDKTGTLTMGEPQIDSSYVIKNNKINTLPKTKEIYYLSQKLSQNSNHPLAKSLAKDINNKKITLKNIIENPGKGLKALYKNNNIIMGKKEFVLSQSEIKKIDQIFALRHNNNIQYKQYSQIYVKYLDEIAIFNFKDELKKDSHEVIRKLNILKKEVFLLSGDQKIVVENISRKLGIKKFFYNKNPIEKSEIIKELNRNNKKTIMCGDGINDAPSLIASDVGISFCKASDLSKNCAQILIQGNNLSAILEIFNESRQANILIKQNLILSFSYNIIAIPFAMFGFVTPFIAALSMSFSSILVILNSLRNKKINIKIN